MKFKFALCGAAIVWALSSFAQAPFTILRPVNGAHVRELIKLEMPRRSIPFGGYIGIYLDNSFIEAVAPDDDGKNPGSIFRYFFDTKARKIADGPHTFEVVLYGGEPPRMLDKSQVQIVVANNDVKVPKIGVKLRYKFEKTLTYKINIKQVYSTISTNQQQLGSNATEIPISERNFNFEIEPIRMVNSSNYVVRTRILPPYFVGDLQNPEWVNDVLLSNVDEFVSNRGVVYGVNTTYFHGDFNPNGPVFPNGAPPASLLYIHLMDYPLLPAEPVKAGDTWFAKIKVHKASKIFTGGLTYEDNYDTIPARGVIDALNWERGYRSAQVHYSFSQDMPGQKMPIAGVEIGSLKQTLDQVIAFAFDSGVMLKSVQVSEIEGLASGAIPGAGALAQGGGNQGNPFGGQSITGGGTRGGSGEGRGGGAPGMGPAIAGGTGGGIRPPVTGGTTDKQRIKIKTIVTMELIK